jgi:hypothetical protein
MLWRRELGGNGYEWPWATTADPDGNVYFGGITTSREGLHTAGPDPKRSGDGFIAKLDRHGNLQWTRVITTGDGEEVRDLAFAGGRLLAIGHTFGNLSATGPSDESLYGRSDIWIASFDEDGHRIGAIQLGTPEHERASFDVRDDIIHVGGRTFGSMSRPKDSAGLEPFLLRLPLAALQ